MENQFRAKHFRVYKASLRIGCARGARGGIACDRSKEHAATDWTFNIHNYTADVESRSHRDIPDSMVGEAVGHGAAGLTHTPEVRSQARPSRSL